jgi:hypothetical protein
VCCCKRQGGKYSALHAAGAMSKKRGNGEVKGGRRKRRNRGHMSLGRIRMSTTSQRSRGVQYDFHPALQSLSKSKSRQARVNHWVTSSTVIVLQTNSIPIPPFFCIVRSVYSIRPGHSTRVPNDRNTQPSMATSRQRVPHKWNCLRRAPQTVLCERRAQPEQRTGKGCTE